MSNVNETLKERGKVYGDYKGGSEFRANVMKLIKDRHLAVNGKNLDAVQMVYIYDIVNKLSRLATTPDHIDTWHDIAGYATLVEKALTAVANEAENKDSGQDDEEILSFIAMVKELTGDDSDITKLAIETYEYWKRSK
jgi:hypothetical protein|nr:MAG TPA: hypothetical protein [Caudoviricetes sp.]